MPRQYEEIKASELARGKSEKEAKRIAAATWNSRHPNDPITPHREPTGNYAARIAPATIGGANFDASAPKKVIDLYHDHYQQQRDGGHEHDRAHRYAMTMVRHAGWYKGSGGKWKQLTPDLRDKVNVREAVKQPDGRYVIEGVDVFYPNAAKGKSLPFDADDIQEIIENTNRGIAAGGQKPGLVEGHPNELQAALGTQLPVYGAPVNFRNSPRGRGWARCDLVDVDPSVIERLRKRQLSGLSAGIAKDASGLNRRFGHVALLGGTTQALSHLPTTEIYSVSNQLCFSADAGCFTPKGAHMPKKISEMYESANSAYAAYEAAMASHEAGEPGSVEKLREAGNKWKAAVEALKCMQDPDGETHGDEYNAPEVTVPPGEQGDAPMATVPGAAPETPGFATVDGINFSEDPAGAFDKLSRIVNAERAEKAKLVGQLRTVTKIAEGLTGRVLRSDFSAEIEKLERDGHLLPGKDEIEEQFSAAIESANPRKTLDRFIKTLRSLPKKASPAAAGQVFTNESAPALANFSATDADIDASLTRVQSILGAYSFSEQEQAMGRAASRSHLPVK